jgi:hypothetical protein
MARKVRCLYNPLSIKVIYLAGPEGGPLEEVLLVLAQIDRKVEEVDILQRVQRGRTLIEKKNQKK